MTPDLNGPNPVLSYGRPDGPKPYRWIVFTWFLCLLPLLSVLPAVAMYLKGWVILGRPPRPRIDDPKLLPLDSFYPFIPCACLLWPLSLIVTPLWLLAFRARVPNWGVMWVVWGFSAAVPLAFEFATAFTAWFAD